MLKYFLCSVGVLALSTAASAQEANPDRAGAASAPNQAGIDDIIVTASRREENIQKSALSIQAFSSDTLVRANVTRAEDLSKIAPGVEIGTAGAFAQPYIRGVGNFSVTSYAESSVAFNLDGVYISRSWAVRGSFYDLDRVEVLKGPQGTLYGRNASGGAINIITAKPKLGQVGGFGELQVGNYGLIQGAGAINLPLGDTLALRASGQVISRNGYLSDGYDDDETQSARLQMLWEPSSDVSLRVSGQYQHIGGRGAGAAMQPQLPGDKWRGIADPAITSMIRSVPFIGAFLPVPKTDGFLDIDVYSITGELNWNLGFATLTVLPAYRDSVQQILTYTAGFPSQTNEKDKQTSLEVRLGNSGDQLKWVLGAYYFDEQIENLPGRSELFATQGVATGDVRNLDFNTRSYAAFGQATYSLTDRFRVTGGLRYTYERKRNESLFLFYNPPGQVSHACDLPGSVFDPTAPVPPTFCRLDIPQNDEQTFNSVTWRGGVEYDLAPRSMAYLTVGTGFKSGGIYTAPAPNSFKPEKLTSFEAGIKSRFLDNRLQVNIEAFLWKYKDHQESFFGGTSLPGFYTFVTKNAGRATLYGADLDVIFRPTAQDELSFKVQYNKTNYDSFSFQYPTIALGPPLTGCGVGPLVAGEQTIDCSGKSLIRAPLWTGTAGYNHTFDLGSHGSVNASFDLQFASASDLSIDFLESGRQEAYAVGNFDLTYTSADQKWVVSAFVHNIWNEAVYNQTFHYPFVAPSAARPDGVFFGTLRPPRTFGGRIRMNF